ncbi:MAG: helix-turn-helix transcriptional regulator, partial [Acidimicrobiia bacterium]
LEVGDEPGQFERPQGFDPKSIMSAQPWEAGSDEATTARIRFDESVAWWAGRTLGMEVERGAELVHEVPVTNRDALAGWVLSFGASAEVLSPPDIRDDIRSRVNSALESLP